MSEIYTDPPQSRNEAIIRATIDGTRYTAPPQSRMEDLLLELKEAIEQGGGTKDYEALDNKPSINDVELSGNKTSSDLGLMDHYDIDEAPTEDSENLIPSGAVWEANQSIEDKLQGTKSVSSTSGTIEIPDYGMTESIDMYFKPTQDLHGYDKPWVGGAGFNKVDENSMEIGKIDASGQDVSVTDDRFWRTRDYFSVLPSTVYYNRLSTGFTVSNANNNVYCYDANKQILAEHTNVGTTTFITPEGCAFIRITSFFAQKQTTYPTGLCLNVSDASKNGTFEPYSNICPISGQDNATFSWTDSHDIENEASMNFGKTYYGGFCQFATGAIYSEWDYIASYNGETLPSEWMSDRDEYQAGTTPTIGAEVAYKTTPTMAVVRKGDMNLTDDYPMQFNGWMASIVYQPKNTVLEKAKQYTNQKISALGFPTPPTTDGTYHLECSVSGGIPTIRWVSNS